MNAARERAEALGFKVVIDNSCDDWDYVRAARYLLERFHALRREHPRLCLLSSGEVTVRLGPDPGCGGRNQQLALTAALDLAEFEGENWRCSALVGWHRWRQPGGRSHRRHYDDRQRAQLTISTRRRRCR